MLLKTCHLDTCLVLLSFVVSEYSVGFFTHISGEYPSSCDHCRHLFQSSGFDNTFLRNIYIYIILIARVRVQYGKIFYEHAKYFHEPKASENVA